MTDKEAAEIIKIAISEVEWEYPVEYAAAFAKAIQALEQQPKTGHWVRQTDDYYDYYECEHCGIGVGLDDIKNYCPNCGARMIEPPESEDKE